MSYTHKKRTYHATCIQWTDESTHRVKELLSAHAEVTEYSGSLMLRWNSPTSHKMHIDMFHPSMWIRIGENGQMKTMTDQEFQLKYEEI